MNNETDLLLYYCCHGLSYQSVENKRYGELIAIYEMQIAKRVALS